MAQFLNHDWPGNVRELKNAAERSFYRWHADGRVGPVDAVFIDPFAEITTPSDVGSHHKRQPYSAKQSANEQTSIDSTNIMDLRAYLDQAEKEIVAKALAGNGWNQRRTAKALNLTYDQIRGIVRKYDLSAPQ